MKKILFCLLMACGFVAKAQVYNNEWIDYGKTYYKFKVGKTGLHRLSQAKLDSAGLGNVPAEQFQLWRNGAEVPVYTSVETGVLPGGGFIEFWGVMNDGKPDRALYRRPEYHLNDHYSLHTDTATYFLTVNPSGNNFRLSALENNLAGNTLAPEPYFLYTKGQYFKNQLYGGFANYVDPQYVYSSSYESGEGYASAYIGANGTNTVNFGNLFVYTGGPAARFTIAVSGSALAERRYRVRINSDSILGKKVDFLHSSTDSADVALSSLTSATTNINVTNISAVSTDRMVVHKYELTYPRQFNFGNAANFEFTLPASNAPRYLEISGFNNSSAAPVLYDLANGRRYVGDISVAGNIRVLVQPSGRAQRLVLASMAATNITNVGALQRRNFVDYSNGANQGDYLIISNRLLFGGSGSNPVEEYRQYRSSAAGGGYTAQVYEVEELTDQFGYGIKKTPLAIRNFILYARKQFAAAPRQVFLIGKGVVYTSQRSNESNASINLLNLVPTFGHPASDVLLAAEPGSSLARVSIGRLSAVSAQEVRDYLGKVKEYEAAQQAPASSPLDKEWMKNVVHLVGSGDVNLQTRIERYMSSYKEVITDTFFGGRVYTFSKQTGNSTEVLNSKDLEDLFAKGISLITYFGHSGSSQLEFNLDNPEAYNNRGKYPLFVAMGCNAGDFFAFNSNRFTQTDAIAEKYVLEKERGTIGFIANTHYSIVTYLNIWCSHAYKAMGVTAYGKSIGEILNATAASVFGQVTEENFYARANIEETSMHGDPAITVNPHPKPDYVLTDAMVQVAPNFVSVAEKSFTVKANIKNVGKAVDRNIVVEIKRRYPNQTSEVVYRQSMEAVRYSDSLLVELPIDAARDKGVNRLTITVDADNAVDELAENNNTVEKEINIYEDEVKPVYPYAFSMVTDADVNLVASTANPLSPVKNYRVEMDTTELFNSSLKQAREIRTAGGIIEYKPGTAFRDGQVYYWRVAEVPESGELRWNTSSFLYKKDGEPGFNQSHIYQHLKSTTATMPLDSASRTWRFKKMMNDLFIRFAVWGTATGQEADVVVNVNNESYIRNTCNFGIIINVFDGVSFKPWRNQLVNGKGLYESLNPTCAPSRNYNFEYTNDTAGRRKAYGLLAAIPEGSYVVIRNQFYNDSAKNQYVDKWKQDALYYGAGKTFYDEVKRHGSDLIDSVTRPRAFAIVYQKNNAAYDLREAITAGKFDKMTLSTFAESSDSKGEVLSPVFGPAKAWKEMLWDGSSLEQSSQDIARVNVIGVRADGSKDTVLRNIGRNQVQTDISSVQAAQYPYLQLHLFTRDTANFTPYQLKSWRLTYEPVAEGAVAPNMHLAMKDSLAEGEPIDFQLAFKNVSKTAFDSLRVHISVVDQNNVAHVFPVTRHRPLAANDTLHVRYLLDTRLLRGKNTLYVDVNPQDDQPEQTHFNNFLYKSFHVQSDQTRPLLDVTFDQVHILNNDIVSAKPDILIKLKDESSKLLLNDSSLVSLKVRYPDQSTRTFRFDGDTLRFVPAVQGGDNTASVQFRPHFDQDGTYELSVAGYDKSGNQAGGSDYKINFQVINKPMISNLLNYPNPFTTSTAFVFTLTGSEVPQNFKIQILTVTGKIVREITRQELGAIKIGRNITEFKWDGTDQFGQKLGNGVYLYRVVTQVNGKSLDKYTAEGDNTDKYFNKGYGKMYLMR